VLRAAHRTTMPVEEIRETRVRILPWRLRAGVEAFGASGLAVGSSAFARLVNEINAGVVLSVVVWFVMVGPLYPITRASAMGPKRFFRFSFGEQRGPCRTT